MRSEDRPTNSVSILLFSGWVDYCSSTLRRNDNGGGTLEDEKEYDDEDEDAMSTVAPSIAQSKRSIRRTESERQALLESDPRVEEVKPDEALCKKCQKWVKLSLKLKYELAKWNRHQARCSGSLYGFPP